MSHREMLIGTLGLRHAHRTDADDKIENWPTLYFGNRSAEGRRRPSSRRGEWGTCKYDFLQI